MQHSIHLKCTWSNNYDLLILLQNISKRTSSCHFWTELLSKRITVTSGQGQPLGPKGRRGKISREKESLEWARLQISFDQRYVTLSKKWSPLKKYFAGSGFSVKCKVLQASYLDMSPNCGTEMTFFILCIFLLCAVSELTRFKDFAKIRTFSLSLSLLTSVHG